MMFTLKHNLYRSATITLLCLLTACTTPEITPKSENKPPIDPNKIEAGVYFKNITLEQADPTGKPMWKVTAKQVSYSNDKKLAKLSNPSGQLYSNGQVVLNLVALKGQIVNNGDKISLEGDITAIDPRNGIILRGQLLDWIPKESLLIMKNNIVVNHKDLQLTSQQAVYHSNEQKLDVEQNVIAIAQQTGVQLTTKQLTWSIPQKIVKSTERVQFDKSQNKQLTEQAIAKQAQWNLKTNLITLNQDAQITQIEPAVQILSQKFNWNVNSRIISADQVIKIWHGQERLEITGNKGEVDLKKNIATLTNRVRAIGGKYQSQLYADNMTWFIKTKQVQAEGNIIYRQENPPLNLSGNIAQGNLINSNLTIKGSKERVITRIVAP